MAKKQEIEFLATGEITWVNRSGTKEQQRHVQEGDRLHVRVVQQGDDFELWDGNWSVLMPAKNVKIVEHFPISFAVYKGDQKIGSHSVRNEKEKRDVLKALRMLYGKLELRDDARPVNYRRKQAMSGKDPFRDADRHTICPKCGEWLSWNKEDGLKGQTCSCGYIFTGRERNPKEDADNER